MKRAFLIIAVTFGFAIPQQLTLNKPPRSLERYYPPQSQNFEYIKNMQAMSVAFHAINTYINEGRWDRALEWANRLKKAYEESARMVPEWKDLYKPELAENLVRAVQQRNVDSVIKASRELGQTCSGCHREHQAVVKLYYHFPRYDGIKVFDPVELQELKTKDYMKKMTDSMKALILFLSDGDDKAAKEHGIHFVERAKQMSSMCSVCHPSPSSIESLAGKDYQRSLERLQSMLNSARIERQEIFKQLSEIGQYCYRCHNVHLIPVLFQNALK